MGTSKWHRLTAASLTELVLHGGQGSMTQKAAILQEAELLPLCKTVQHLNEVVQNSEKRLA